MLSLRTSTDSKAFASVQLADDLFEVRYGNAEPSHADAVRDFPRILRRQQLVEVQVVLGFIANAYVVSVHIDANGPRRVRERPFVQVRPSLPEPPITHARRLRRFMDRLPQGERSVLFGRSFAVDGDLRG